MSHYNNHFCDTDYKTLITYDLTLFKHFSSVLPVVDFLLSLHLFIGNNCGYLILLAMHLLYLFFTLEIVRKMVWVLLGCQFIYPKTSSVLKRQICGKTTSAI